MPTSKDLDSTTLEELLVKIQTLDHADALLTALLSDRELFQMRNRWEAAKLLHQGETLASVVSGLGISMATASRASMMRKSGDFQRLVFLIEGPGVRNGSGGSPEGRRGSN